MPFSNRTTYDFWNTKWNTLPGVYGIMDAQRQMLYVGETDDFSRRMDEHRADKAHAMHRHKPALVLAEIVNGGAEARRKRESALIAEYAPLCNG